MEIGQLVGDTIATTLEDDEHYHTQTNDQYTTNQTNQTTNEFGVSQRSAMLQFVSGGQRK